jgi:leucyl-tRNA synthetase
MFPYPSGALHMGHLRNYSIGDLLARFLWMKGFNVLHPMGFDAFGLPAENAAIKYGVHPHQWTWQNIEHMTDQLKRMGCSYDWRRRVESCNPDYYRWTQWLFLQFFKKGLAYRKHAPVNWCSDCQTVLANEQVIDGGHCWRCHTPVTKRALRAVFLRILRLCPGVARLTRRAFPGGLREYGSWQENWIGRSEGVRLGFSVPEFGEKSWRRLPTRFDTIFGRDLPCPAPEHPWVEKNSFARLLKRRKLRSFLFGKSLPRSEIDRTAVGGEKKGFFTGYSAVNSRETAKRVPCTLRTIFLIGIRHGAIMGVSRPRPARLRFCP